MQGSSSLCRRPGTPRKGDVPGRTHFPRRKGRALPMVEFDVKIEAKDLYDYMLAHSYNSGAGILGSCVGALMVVIAFLSRQWIFLICGAVLLIYLPWVLFLKSRQQAKNNPAFARPLHYRLDEEGISVSQDGQTQSQAWRDMYKAVSTAGSIVVYTTRTHAAIFPKRQLGDQLGAVVQTISTHMPPRKVKIRS